ncbi:hypothetical protein AB9N12_16820 [Bacteroides sp. AN502(2024)]|uniref:hypothetical protein n=1 Tax=Bacteroides sp. AN502(2024) TaxID=3160599 RepID=UPI0035118164
MGTKDRQMRKERNLRYWMRKKGYLFNREQRVVIFRRTARTAVRYRKNGCGHWDIIFSIICFKQISNEYKEINDEVGS